MRPGVLLLAAAVLAALLAWKVWGFRDPTNIQKLLVDMALVAIGSVGLTVAMAGGGIDISVGAILAVAAACAALAGGGSAPFSLVAAVAVGAVLGALNGATSALTRLHSAIVTLVALIAYTSLFLALLGGQDAVTVPQGVQSLAQARVLGLQSVVWIAGAVTVAGGLLLHRRARETPLAAGSTQARLRSVLNFGICGAAAGLAGVLYAGEYGRLGPTVGRGFGLEVLAAAVLGGASLRGGAGSVAGTVAGAVLVGVLQNGMTMLTVGEMAQAAVFGAVVVVALLANRMLRR